MFQVTKEWLDRFSTPRGGYTDLQIRSLGFPAGMHTPKWRKKSVGKVITQKQKELFEEFSCSKLTKKAEKEIRKRIDAGLVTLEQISAEYSSRVEGIEWKLKYDLEFVKTEDFLKTQEWAKVRMSTLVKYGARCQCCGTSAKQGATICVDHIKPRKFFPQFALDENNLQVLCDTCNLGKGNVYIKDWT